MSASKSIEDILHQVNRTLAPGERISPDQIRDVGHQLDNLLHEAQGPEWQAESVPVPELTLKQRLVLFWQAIKEKLAAWLQPICPRWRKLISRLKQILLKVSEQVGQDTLLSAVLIVVVVAVAAALLHSLPLIIALLSTIGFVSLARLFERATHPGFLRAG